MRLVDADTMFSHFVEKGLIKRYWKYDYERNVSDTGRSTKGVDDPAMVYCADKLVLDKEKY